MPAASRKDALTRREAAGLFAPLGGHESLAIAVSGGADSVALMWLMARWNAARRAPARLHVFTIDHGLRRDAAAEARKVAGYAGALGLPHRMLRWQGAKPARNIQAEARAARYRLLAQACHAAGIPALVTAHHLEDQAETVLLRLIRGSGVDGLAAMAPATQMMGLTVLRPLLDVSRARLRQTLHAAQHGWIEDPSNEDERFARTRIRKLMRGLAGEGLDAGNLAATAARMRRARIALDAAADELARTAVTTHPAGYAAVPRDALVGAPEETGLRLLARILMAVGGNAYRPRLDRLERLYFGLKTGSRRHATLSGCKVSLNDGEILVRREAGRTGLPEIDLEPGASALWDGRFHVTAARNAAPVRVRALGQDGWRELKPLMKKADLRPDAARTSVSFWQDGALVAAPFVMALAAGDSPYSARFVGAIA